MIVSRFSRPACRVSFWAAVGTAVLSPTLASLASAATMLDFEHTPSGALPVDNQPLTDAYPIPGGTARMFFDLNGNNVYDPGVDAVPDFEHVGNDTTNAFISQWAGNGVYDTARPGYEAQLGNFFLRKPTGQGGGPVPGPFIVAYDTTEVITQLSGEIWDIDGSEQWRVDVLNASGGVLASEVSPTFNGSTGLDSLDSLPWLFAFADLPPGVTTLRLTQIGDAGAGIGLAFNNFSPTVAVPEPSGLLVAAISAGLLRHRRQNAIH